MKNTDIIFWILGIIALGVGIYLASKWFNIAWWKIFILYWLIQFSNNIDYDLKGREKE